MFSGTMFRRIPCVAMASFVVLSAAVVSRGQAKIDPISSREEVETPFYRNQEDFRALKEGKMELMTKDGRMEPKVKSILDTAAKFYVDRVTWPKAIANPDEMFRVYGDFDSLIRDVVDSQKPNLYFARVFGRHLAPRFEQVLSLDFDRNRLAVVNAAVMLPRLARCKSDEVEALLLSLINNDKKHDAIKNYALRALGEFYPAESFDVDLDASNAGKVDRMKRDVVRTDALLKFLDRKDWALPANPTKQDMDALIFVRREAVKSLAQAKVPAVAIDPKKSEVHGAALYGLLKVVGKEGLNPPAALSEKIEAAIGLAVLKTDIRHYQPEYGLYALALAELEVVNAYRQDHAAFKGGFVRKVPMQPWKAHAKRFLDAHEEMVKNAKYIKGSAPDITMKLKRATEGIYASMGKHENVDGVNELADVVQELRKSSPEVFKGVKGPTIELK